MYSLPAIEAALGAQPYHRHATTLISQPRVPIIQLSLNY